jgi:hypothetical protein
MADFAIKYLLICMFAQEERCPSRALCAFYVRCQINYGRPEVGATAVNR